jgi:hypothetical protein
MKTFDSSISPSGLLERVVMDSPSSLAICSVNQGAGTFRSKRGKIIWHQPQNIRAELPTLVSEAECDRVISGSAVAAVVPVRTKNDIVVWVGFLDRTLGVRHFGFTRFSVLISHNVELSCRKGPTKKLCYPGKLRQR